MPSTEAPPAWPTRVSGNSVGCAVLEMTLVGGVYQAQGSLAMALAGGADGGQNRPARSQRAISSAAFELFTSGWRAARLEPHPAGRRTYLAVKGGWQTSPILGSRSSEQPIRAGQILSAATASVRSRHLSEPAWPRRQRRCGSSRDPTRDSIPRVDDAFWARHRFQVGPRHDRTGLRLESEPVTVVVNPDRLSTPVAPGAIQVAGGQLIILGVACGTMGGYPHVAHLISADLDRLGQLKAGNQLTFQRVTIEEVRSLHLEWLTRQRSLIARVGMLAADE